MLAQAGLHPDAMMPASIDETPRRAELPRVLAARLAREKAVVAAALVKGRPDLVPAYTVAADTVVAVGRRILPKCEVREQAEDCLALLSGRAHRVFTGVTLVTPSGRERHRLVETRVRFKRLSSLETDSYLASREWLGKAGGYAIQGLAEAFVIKLVGSRSAVVGLPLYETVNLLAGDGFPVHEMWRLGEVAEQP